MELDALVQELEPGGENSYFNVEGVERGVSRCESWDIFLLLQHHLLYHCLPLWPLPQRW